MYAFSGVDPGTVVGRLPTNSAWVQPDDGLAPLRHLESVLDSGETPFAGSAAGNRRFRAFNTNTLVYEEAKLDCRARGQRLAVLAVRRVLCLLCVRAVHAVRAVRAVPAGNIDKWHM